MAKITIYSTPTCGFCRMAKEYLASKSIPYAEIDVSTDPAKQKELAASLGAGRVEIAHGGKILDYLRERGLVR